MGSSDWNRGMDDAFFGIGPRRNTPDYIEGYAYGTPHDPGPSYNPPEPTLEEMCNPHPYHGDDVEFGRCYCGAVQYPLGGPATDEGGGD